MKDVVFAIFFVWFFFFSLWLKFFTEMVVGVLCCFFFVCVCLRSHIYHVPFLPITQLTIPLHLTHHLPITHHSQHTLKPHHLT